MTELKKLLNILTGVSLLVGLMILSTACETTWKNRPHVGDYQNERILFKGNHSANEIYCKQPEFENYICWHYDEIADLIALLETHNIKPVEAKKIKKIIKKITQSKTE